jgi:hypothetical protein
VNNSSLSSLMIQTEPALQWLRSGCDRQRRGQRLATVSQAIRAEDIPAGFRSPRRALVHGDQHASAPKPRAPRTSLASEAHSATLLTPRPSALIDWLT